MSRSAAANKAYDKVISRLILVLTAFLLVPVAASAGERDMVPSCFEMLKLAAPKSVVKHEIFVVIDQTSPVDDGQQRALITGVLAKLAPATAVTVITFSAFTGDHYADVKFSGMRDRRLSDSERDNTPGIELKQYDACIAQQIESMNGKIGDAMRNGYAKPSDTIARSDILATLKDIGATLVARSPAPQKEVLLISDMLENSTISSFYDKTNLRLIDPQAEMQKAAGSTGDFAGAKIYVAGAGSIVMNGRKPNEADHDPKTLDALEAFWRDYFTKSNAELVAFGKPGLLGQF
jgi:hypothetical protein